MLTINTLILVAAIGAPGNVNPVANMSLDDQTRETIRIGIPYIEEKGEWWIDKKKCVSCHRVGTMLWSLSAAKQRGFEVSDKLERWTDWAIDKSLSENDKGKIVGSANKDGLAQLLLARDLADTESYNATARTKLVDLIVDGQQPDGSWKPDGQLPSQKRELSETTDVTTMWLALALASRESDAAKPAALANALKLIAASQPGASTEWRVIRLLLARQLDDEATATQLIDQLREQQQPNGGWAWTIGDEPDALATGMSLYALLRAGVNHDDDAIERARRFLVTTQQDDGSWEVKGTKAKKKDRIEETAVYWGSTWAVLSLVESLPE